MRDAPDSSVANSCEVARAHSSTDAAGLLFEQIKSRLPFSSTSTKGRGRSNIHLTPIDRLPFQAFNSRSAKCKTFSLTIYVWHGFY
ncbi:hypothetical protein GQ600_10408 [Phytophthora cactorum]|nr:hypothetical protein GQ600_10408 [Phytophthora cactorum]